MVAVRGEESTARGQPEVTDFDGAVVADQHVFRLDIAVDEACTVRCGECLEHREHHAERLGRAEPPRLAQHLAQGAALDQLHHQEDHIAVAALVGDGDDLRAAEAGGSLCLPAETSDEILVGGEDGMHDLDRDLTIEPGVERGVDDRHAALREPALDLVTAVEHPTHQRITRGRTAWTGAGVDDGPHARSLGSGWQSRGYDATGAAERHLDFAGAGPVATRDARGASG